ncbi:glycosyltransferase family A protein [Kutzneria sp. CA-103260]|uniref:glycosyltransferase family A protein n=1 Tax=Kutzneria sp. CA-103260 TaxID=2802641 RepID=UPI001BEF1893|nr:glycosyltransferase family A protein [Kutzneria sp. CA-103260]QUQ65337.1 Glycosyl transferase family 2 [Kutzneria sp. CA-103260]
MIVPTVGRASLVTVLDCLAAQTVPIQTVVVDDSGDGRGAELFREWRDQAGIADAPHTWRVVSTPGAGLSAARNLGMSVSSGAFLGFVDDDDLLCPHHFERLHALGGDFVWSGTTVVVVRSDRDAEALGVGFGWSDVTDKLPVTNVIPPSSVLVRRGLLPGFDERLPVQEDWEAWLCLLDRGVVPMCTDVVTVGYVKNVAAATSSTVRSALDADALRPFVDGHRLLCQRHGRFPAAIAERRLRWRARLSSWMDTLARGGQLPPDYYESALASAFGPPVTRRCCEFDFAAAALATAVRIESREVTHQSRNRPQFHW